MYCSIVETSKINATSGALKTYAGTIFGNGTSVNNLIDVTDRSVLNGVFSRISY